MSAAPPRAPAAGPDVDPAPELPDLGLTDIAVLSCLTEAGLALSEQVQLRHDCLLQLVAVNGDGSFGGAALAWAEAAQAALIASGTAPARLRVVARSEDLRPADLIVNLQGFGCGWKARHLQTFIDTRPDRRKPHSWRYPQGIGRLSDAEQLGKLRYPGGPDRRQ